MADAIQGIDVTPETSTETGAKDLNKIVVGIESRAALLADKGTDFGKKGAENISEFAKKLATKTETANTRLTILNNFLAADNYHQGVPRMDTDEMSTIVDQWIKEDNPQSSKVKSAFYGEKEFDNLYQAVKAELQFFDDANYKKDIDGENRIVG